MKATLLVVLLLFFFSCLVELWKGENFHSLSETLIGRESQYDIGVGSTNEMKHFLVFIIRKALLVSGPTPRL